MRHYTIIDLNKISLPNNTRARYRGVDGVLRKYRSGYNRSEEIFFLSNSMSLRGKEAPDIDYKNIEHNKLDFSKLNYSWILKEDGAICSEYADESIYIHDMNFNKLELL